MTRSPLPTARSFLLAFFGGFLFLTLAREAGAGVFRSETRGAELRPEARLDLRAPRPLDAGFLLASAVHAAARRMTRLRLRLKFGIIPSLFFIYYFYFILIRI